MASDTFRELESAPLDATRNLDSILDALTFNEEGLLPAVAQDINTREVLMLAWMNRTAIEQTLESGQVCYWSRSRAELWRKGDTSGHRQRLEEMRIDCDGDAILLLVEQTDRPAIPSAKAVSISAWARRAFA